MKPGPVSLIIPSYNAATYLAEAIDCALSQTLPPRQILVIDDGSKDNTEEVCKPYLDRITYIRQENRGEAGARNRALEMATGEFIGLLDADDRCAPDRLARQVAALEKRADAVCCLSGHWVFSEGQGQVDYPGIPDHAQFGPIDFFCRLLAHPITMMFRREAARSLQFPIGVKTGGDMIFTGLLRRQGNFVIIPDVLYGYRRHPSQITACLTAMDSLRLRLAWLREHREETWPEVSYEDVEAAMWRGYAEALALSYWTRRKTEFLSLQQELRREWPSHLPRPDELNWRWHPDWVWNLKSTLDRFLRSNSSRTAEHPKTVSAT